MAIQGEPRPPAKLEGALHSLYSNYEKAFERWRESGVLESGETPPVFIVVCNNTNVSKLVFDFIAGWQKEITAHGEPVLVPGKLPLFSNVEDGRWINRPRTILVDSRQLESGEGPTRCSKAGPSRRTDAFRIQRSADSTDAQAVDSGRLDTGPSPDQLDGRPRDWRPDILDGHNDGDRRLGGRPPSGCSVCRARQSMTTRRSTRPTSPTREATRPPNAWCRTRRPRRSGGVGER